MPHALVAVGGSPFVTPASCLTVRLDHEEEKEAEEVIGSHLRVVRNAERHERPAHRADNELAPVAAHDAERAGRLARVEPALDQAMPPLWTKCIGRSLACKAPSPFVAVRPVRSSGNRT